MVALHSGQYEDGRLRRAITHTVCLREIGHEEGSTSASDQRFDQPVKTKTVTIAFDHRSYAHIRAGDRGRNRKVSLDRIQVNDHFWAVCAHVTNYFRLHFSDG
ncbi:hypothetical protein GCM10010520_54550 [Rhizobium viscosum]